jgi:hypothetical protein
VADADASARRPYQKESRLMQPCPDTPVIFLLHCSRRGVS